MTGQKMKTQIFIGPTYYQRLKHFVDHKVHARASKGYSTILTRQPVEGRARGGGLRFGEMECDCAASYGASAFLNQRLYHASNPFTMDTVKIPYSSKLLFQMLNASCIKTKIDTI